MRRTMPGSVSVSRGVEGEIDEQEVEEKDDDDEQETRRRQRTTDLLLPLSHKRGPTVTLRDLILAGADVWLWEDVKVFGSGTLSGHGSGNGSHFPMKKTRNGMLSLPVSRKTASLEYKEKNGTGPLREFWRPAPNPG
jgi:hypothetical protein